MDPQIAVVSPNLTETVILQQGSINRYRRLGALRDSDGDEQNLTRRVPSYIHTANATLLGDGVGNDAALLSRAQPSDAERAEA